MPDVHENLSSVLGWISIACWIVVFSPQIYENYALQSGEGLSVLFVLIWLLGDAFNLIGAIAGGLLPTVILLGLYYFICDSILLVQIYYYRWKQRRSPPPEQRPLLGTNHALQLVSASWQMIQYTMALFFVLVVGVAAWWMGATVDPQDPPPQSGDQPGVKILGWLSAILYVGDLSMTYILELTFLKLGARIPQISKNFKTRCEGLSPALFFFAIFGNLTYSLSICVKSTDPQYLALNAGWLAGSALTVFLDAFVVCQIFYYRTADVSPQMSVDGE